MAARRRRPPRRHHHCGRSTPTCSPTPFSPRLQPMSPHSHFCKTFDLEHAQTLIHLLTLSHISNR